MIKLQNSKTVITAGAEGSSSTADVENFIKKLDVKEKNQVN